MGKKYTLEDDFKPIITGKVLVPNFEEVELAIGVGSIAAGGSLYTVQGVQNAKIPGNKSNWGTWARYFLNQTQGGIFDGSGYVMFYEGGFGKSSGRIGKFAICIHKVVKGAGANPNRGWHPASCDTCGIDLSVDSGD